jgi:signal transduction histidine kinase/CheY-like chemotaxis protein
MSNLTARYVAALCTIALLVGSGPFLVISVLEQQDAYRKLIEHVSNFSDQVQAATQLSVSSQLSQKKKNWDQVESALKDLHESYLLFRQEALELKLPYPFEKAFYPHLIDVDIRYRNFVRTIHQLGNQAPKSRNAAGIIHRINQEDHLLSAAVRLCILDLEKAASEIVSGFKRIEWIFTALTLVVLILEGLFILRPAVLRVEKSLVDLKRSENQLLEAKEEAIEALNIRSEFITKVSHEIRNPLNAILGAAELLWEARLSTSQRRHVEICRRAGQSILDLINEFLDFSRLESGRLELEKIQYDLIETLERSIDILANRADEKGLELYLDFDWNLPSQIIGDPKRIQQILVNLLGNAVKFTTTGYVKLHVRKEERVGEGESLVFEVSDTGIGIPNDRQNRIFDSFVQVDSSITRKFGGNGLGLSICKELVEMMNGQISLRSEVGKGSTFTVAIPFVSADKGSFFDQFKNIDLKGLRLGVLDSNSVSYNAVERIAQYFHMSVEKIRPMPLTLASLDYDIVLVGQEFLENILQLKSYAPSFPFPKMIWFSKLRDLNQISTKVSISLQSVCISKPVKITQVIQVIVDIQAGYKLEKMAPQVTSNRYELPPAKILIVEDSDDNRLILQTYLSGEPVQAVFAVNGREGVRKFSQEKFDLIFMDLQMPEMDGFTAAREIRKHEAEHSSNEVPMIALSAYGHKEEIKKCLDAGCNRHLTKPIRKAVLFQVIKETLKDFSPKLTQTYYEHQS